MFDNIVDVTLDALEFEITFGSSFAQIKNDYALFVTISFIDQKEQL